MVSPRALALFALVVGCDADDAKPSPAPPSAAAPAPEFLFAPTLAAHAPAGVAMELVAEVGDAATGTMTLVLAQHDGTTVSMVAWRFSSTGEDDTLEPDGLPAPLLAVLPGQVTNRDALDALQRTRAAGHTVKSRPQGIPASGPQDALDELRALAIATLSDGTASRAQALARFARGLDDGLLFSRSGLSRALVVASSPMASPRAESERRATFENEQHRISMLKKGEGWVIDAAQ